MRKCRVIYGILLALGIISCASRAPVMETEQEPEIPQEMVAEPDYITIIAVGDNLYHDVMVRYGEEGNYEEAYQEIRPLVYKADFAIINQETLLAGKDFGFSGYPLFNTPQKLGLAIAETGFNVVNHATNHIMDKGEKAVFATMDFWDTVPEVTVLGIHRSREQRAIPKLLSRNNITVGFLSYTYGTNGIRLPADKPYLVSLIDTKIMAEEIDFLRPLCNFLVVSMHWGEEYRHDYSQNQEKLALFLAEHFVDLVIGHHPHAIQPMEYIKRPDDKDMLCFYSLGNLISAQARNPTMLGAMAYIRIKKQPDSDREYGTIITEAGAIPLVTHYEKDYINFKVYPLYAYTEELSEKHRINQGKKELTPDYMTELTSKIFGEKEIRQNPFMQ